MDVAGVAAKAIEVAQAVGAELAELSAMNSLGDCLSQLGDCPQAVDIMREVFERAPALDDIFEMGRAYGNYASALQICGRLEESVEVSADGSEWARRNGVWQTFGIFRLANRASSLIDLGHWPKASDLLARAAEDKPQGVAALNHAVNAGTLAVRMGDLELARPLLRDAGQRAMSSTDAQFAAPIFAGLVELELAEGRLGDAWSIATDGLGRVAQSDNPGLLAFLHAVAGRVAADRALAAAAAHRETERQAAIEREVLTLVADGLTNRRIADRLFISESTAGVHVSNILGKLGVASRTEAAAVAVRLGLAE